MPIIRNFLRGGFGGIIFDVKGSLRKEVYRFAREANRVKDIVEFGMSETALSTNILDGLEPHEIHDVLKKIAMDEVENTQTEAATS